MSTENSLPNLMTVQEFLERFRMHRSKFWRMQKDGLVPPTYKVGKSILIKESDALEWFEKQLVIE